MSKLIDIEIIKAEIERRIENAKEFSRKYFPEKCGASDEADTLEEILLFLDTLPEDANKDLEEAMKDYAKENTSFWQEDGDTVIVSDANKVMDAFRAGAQWKEQQLEDCLN